jgi:hypothetical protein
MLISDSIYDVARKLWEKGLDDSYEWKTARLLLQDCPISYAIAQHYEAEIKNELKKRRLEKLGKKYGV